MEGTIYMDNYMGDFQTINQRQYVCEASFGLSYLTFMTNLLEFFLIGMLFIKFIDIDTKFTRIEDYCKSYINKSIETTDESKSSDSDNEAQSEQEQSDDDSEQEQSDDDSEQEQSDDDSEQEQQDDDSENEQSDEEPLVENLERVKRIKPTQNDRVNRFSRTFRGLRGARPTNIGFRNRFGSALPYTPYKAARPRVTRTEFPNVFTFSSSPIDSVVTAPVETTQTTPQLFTFNDYIRDVNPECECKECN
jgi:flagellar motor protein MotB